MGKQQAWWIGSWSIADWQLFLKRVYVFHRACFVLLWRPAFILQPLLDWILQIRLEDDEFYLSKRKNQTFNRKIGQNWTTRIIIIWSGFVFWAFEASEPEENDLYLAVPNNLQTKLVCRSRKRIVYTLSLMQNLPLNNEWARKVSHIGAK